MRYNEHPYQAMARRMHGDYLRGDVPYEQPNNAIPEGFTALITPWESIGPVEIMWPDSSILMFVGTHDQYMINLRYVFADCKLPFAWRYHV